MYAIGIINLWKYGCTVQAGNNGLQKLRNKTKRGWLSETATLRKVNDAVYVVQDFTQEMCEMSPNRLADYVMSNGTRI